MATPVAATDSTLSVSDSVGDFILSAVSMILVTSPTTFETPITLLLTRDEVLPGVSNFDPALVASDTEEE